MESSDGKISWASFNVDCFLGIFVRVVGFLWSPGIEVLCAQVSIGLRSTIMRQGHLQESNFIYFTCLHEPDLQRPLISFFSCSSTNTVWRVNQAPVVETVHNAIHWINLYLVDSPIKYGSPWYLFAGKWFIRWLALSNLWTTWAWSFFRKWSCILCWLLFYWIFVSPVGFI